MKKLNLNFVTTAYHQVMALLARTTSSGLFVPEIDGLRFVAIGVVVMHHLMGTYLSITNRIGTTEIPSWEAASQKFGILVELVSHGNFGVQLFFVISGFILAVPFARYNLSLGGRRPSLKAYYLRRLKRLEPPYIINMLILYFVRFVMNGAGVQYLMYLGASLIYSHSLIFKEISRISDLTWSLEIEVQFYVLVPLFALFFLIQKTWIRRTVLLVIIAMLGVFPLTSLIPHIASSLNLLGQVQFFLTGFLLADFYLVDWTSSHSKTPDASPLPIQKNFYWDLVSLVGTVLILWIVMRTTFNQALAWLPLPILLFYMGVFRGKISNWIFTRQVIVVIGGMCYTIYLYHTQVIYMSVPKLLAAHNTSRLPLWAGYGIQLLVVIPIILVVCSTLFLLFEKPFMNKRSEPKKSKASVVNGQTEQGDDHSNVHIENTPLSIK